MKLHVYKRIGDCEEFLREFSLPIDTAQFIHAYYKRNAEPTLFVRANQHMRSIDRNFDLNGIYAELRDMTEPLRTYIPHTIVTTSRGRPQRPVPFIFSSYDEAITYVRRKIRRAAHTTTYQIYQRKELVLEVFYYMGRWMDRGKYA